MPRVLICDKLESSGLDLLTHAGLDVDNRPGLKADDLTAARRAAAMDRRGLGLDPFLTAERAAEIGVEKVDDLDSLLPRCDFLTVPTPGGPETKGLIGPEQIAKLKTGARIINCARGGIID